MHQSFKVAARFPYQAEPQAGLFYFEDKSRLRCFFSFGLIFCVAYFVL